MDRETVLAKAFTDALAQIESDLIRIQLRLRELGDMHAAWRQVVARERQEPQRAPEPPPVRSEAALVTMTEACRLLSVSRTTLYNMVAASKLTVVKIGRSSRVRRDDLNGFLRGVPDNTVDTRRGRKYK